MKRFRVFLNKNSGSVARERLKTVVLSDRLGCTPEMTMQIKRDIKRVLAKYLELDKVDVKVRLDITTEVGQGVKNVKTIQIKGL